jgi:ribonuclease E
MANKMLIDTTHPEETRVVVLRGNRVEEFDFESANRRQLRGNIYLAKVTRVEPSLQAAFVDYGGNRHGFLAFSEIHPDYYQIPVADRQALIAEEERAHRDAEDEIDRRASGGGGRGRRPRREHSRRDPVRTQPLEHEGEQPAGRAEHADVHEGGETSADYPDTHQAEAQPPESHGDAPHETDAPGERETHDLATAGQAPSPTPDAPHDTVAEHHDETPVASATAEAALQTAPEPTDSSPATESPDLAPEMATNGEGENGGNIVEIEELTAPESGEDEVVESVGGADAMEEVQERTPRYRRNYKIQEVIKRRQIMLVQVVKEERGTKGAALTTYLSLAGRYSVLMPNTARGGGISRKITNALDRKKLKEIAQELEVPEGMGVILRTAGASRTKTEVKRDFEYLLRLWETVRDFTLKSTAPTLVYEEGSLIKRSIRDLYNKDIEEILVAGEQGHREARDFMRMLMPSHAKNVKLYNDTQPIFTRYGIESQLDAMFTPTVQLKSGGYIVLNQTEALVAIDVNSGRATREHHIEDTALKTNLEASEEIARQLRLRDLAGLIVIDFIDMDEGRNNRLVERRLKESLKNDRARIQVGRISHFGLMEMSRQRIRSSVLESSTDKCPHCGGTGHVRSVSSVTLHLLRMLEEMLLKGATHNLIVRTRSEVALYVLNHKRAHLRELESRFQITITVNADATIGAAQPFLIEKGEQVHSLDAAKAIAAQHPAPIAVAEEEDLDVVDETADEDIEEADRGSEGEQTEERSSEGQLLETGDSQRRGRRRRRGRGGREGREERGPREGGFTHETVAEHAVAHEGDDEGEPAEAVAAGDGQPEHRPGAEQNGGGELRRRRRGRRGGRRNRRGREGEPGFAGANGGQDEHQPHSQGFEPEVADAVADLGGPSRTDAPSAPEPQTPQPFEPVARDTPRDVAPEPAASPEPPRRRSTIREPAPMFSSGAMSDVHPAPAPEPPPSAPEPAATPEPAADEAKPRRFGWWSRRG